MDEIVVQLDDTSELIIELTELTLDIVISDIKPEATIVMTDIDEPDIIEITPDLPFYVEVFEWPNCPDEPYIPSVSLPIKSTDIEHNSITLDTIITQLQAQKGVNGGVFITNIVPTNIGNVGAKITSSNGIVLDSCLTDTKLLTVSIVAITGHSNYIPVITVNDNIVNLMASVDKPIFNGSIDIIIDEDTRIIAKHEDGAQHSCIVNLESIPVITSLNFVGSYPGVQTELKANDTFMLEVKSDVDIKSIEVDDFGACNHIICNVQPSMEHTIEVSIANRGTNTLGYNARVRVQKLTGSWSNWYLTSNKLDLNNSYPQASFGLVTYPIGQKALKNNEIATIINNATNFDTVSYSSPNNELSIVESSIYTSSKTVTRINGTYNISNYNIRAIFTRAANNASTQINGIINIANIAATISITVPYSRLRSPASYIISVASSQQLLDIPTLNAPEGIWLGSSFTTSNYISFSRSISIQDNVTKGAYNFNNLNATNLAGIVTTVISGSSSYSIGGFILRVLIVPAFPVRQVSIGTTISDTTKLRCTNLSKGASGSLNYSYQNSSENAIDKFTVLSSSIWYNCDASNAASNTTGTMQIEIEEVV